MPKAARIPSTDKPSRRKSARRPVQAPVDITVLRSGVPDTVPGRMVELGAGGIGAVLARELLPGELVGIEIQLPDSSRFRTRAVVRYHDKLRCGLEFVGLSPDQQASIQTFAKETGGGQDVALRPPTGTIPEVRPATSLEAAKSVRATKKEAPKAAATKSGGLTSGSSGGSSSGSSAVSSTGSSTESSSPRLKETPQTARISTSSSSSRRGWVFLIASFAILISVLWWRWNRGWQELEAGLRPTETLVQPEAHVSADVMQGLVTHRVDPEYPEAARETNLQGIVVLDVIVGPEGTVVNVKPVSGAAIFVQPAIDALRWWKFRPYRIGGKPATVETTVAVEFKP